MITEEQCTILDAVIQILLGQEKRITISFSRNCTSINLPPTRRIAEYLEIPHYYILPLFASMERDGLITRVERVGISTTSKGTMIILTLIDENYQEMAQDILPQEMMEVLRASIPLKT
ncbi:hypothetical protein RJ53_00430 [Methanocalculus chunghsingensis]|uniref:Uncharacterized protein n=1 Tax=Methanocalculus chunghsingensis TaxID=156457 RepID=A0A8J7W4E3_9EURY|nr:hypothetical protein [Methanocalculus chunghsingensis]MBR1368039.1 hypothetical protein [Methanocalculus chunghsingensis]